MARRTPPIRLRRKPVVRRTGAGWAAACAAGALGLVVAVGALSCHDSSEPPERPAALNVAAPPPPPVPVVREPEPPPVKKPAPPPSSALSETDATEGKPKPAVDQEPPLAMGPVDPASIALPPGWKGPGSPLADRIPVKPRYRNRKASGYHIRINLGYVWGEVLDEKGTSWLPDQIYEPGTYGFIGGGRARQLLPREAIAGTEIPEIYRTGRTRISHYILAIPDGRYEVVLHVNRTADKLYARDFSVSVRGRQVLKSFTIDEKRKIVRKVLSGIEVEGGELDLELAMCDLELCGLEVIRK